MSDPDTPSNQHPAVRPNHDMTVTDYRLQTLETAVRDHTKAFNRWMDKAKADETSTALAIERCSTHGKRLDKVEELLESKSRDPVTFWTAITGAAAAAGAWATHFWSKGG